MEIQVAGDGTGNKNQDFLTACSVLPAPHRVSSPNEGSFL